MTTASRIPAILFTLLLAASPALAAPPVSATPEGVEFFEKKVRPVLVEHCYKCHSAEGKVKGDFRLDTREALFKGGSSQETSVIPGNPDHSLFIRAVRYDHEDLKMPPKAKLPDAAVADLVAWVKMGAPFPADKTAAPSSSDSTDLAKAESHWAFQSVKNPPVPAVKNASWAKNDIDRFILAKLEEKKLAPSGPADKRTLLRRATFDLTGLPPTPEEVDAFLKDASPDAFKKVVDRLLASPAYGERWGRHWLDVVRYADTAGESADYPVPQAYLYRNYVINAFNQDKPYDQFLREQIAGDLMPAKNEAQKHERIIATGFIATARRFSVNPRGEMHLTIEDTIDTLSKSMLGLTVACARCHDHKFDPIPAADYYALYGFFSSTRYPFPGSENDQRQKDLVLLVSEEKAEQSLKAFKEPLAAIDAEIKRLEKEKAELRKPAGDAAKAPEKKETDKPRTVKQINDEIKKLRDKREKVQDQMPALPKAYAVAEANAADAKIQIRGEPYRNGPVVRRGFLQALGGQKLPESAAGSGRLQLADWIADAENPLTARVMVNRIWQHHFGKGLVATPSDFGTRGAPPTHPELLDHLATRFVQNGWSIKSMHRLLMLSAAYQQSSSDSAPGTRNSALSSSPSAPSTQHPALSLDPNNDFLWRFNRRRLGAEEIRDAALAVSGALERGMMNEPHPFPPENKWGFTQHRAFEAVYEHNKRSVYLMQQRIRKHPFFAVFDGADTNFTTAQRSASTTPLQALFMMNNPFVHQQAERLADRMLINRATDRQRIEYAYGRAFSRPATPEEISAAESYLKAYQEKTKSASAATTQPAQHKKAALASLARALFGSNEFVFVD